MAGITAHTRGGARGGVAPDGGRWYAGAIIFHIIAIGILTVLPPSRAEAPLTPGKGRAAQRQAAAAMSSGEIRQVTKSIEKATTAQLAQKLKQLDTIQNEMAALEKKRLDTLRAANPAAGADAAGSLDAMRKARQSMDAAAEAMKKSGADAKPGLEAADAAMTEALNKIPALEEKFRPVVGALDRARATQEQTRQAWTAGAAPKDESDAADALREAQKLANDYAQKVASADEKDKRVTERAAQLEEIMTQIAGMTKQRDAATTDKDKTRFAGKLNNLNNRLADKTRQLDQYRAQAKAYRAALAPRQERVEAAKAAGQGVEAGIAQNKIEAQKLQTQAGAEQDKAIALMQTTMASAATAPTPAPRRDYANLTTEQLYAAARERENAITDSYKAWRAGELAILDNMPLGQALRQTDVVRPQRPDLDKQAAAAGASAAGLDRRKDQLDEALRQTQSMVSLGESLVGSARRRADAKGGGFGVALDNDRAARREQARLASVDLSGRVVDLTKPGAYPLGGQPGAGTGQPGAGTGQPGAGAGTGPGAGAGAGTGAGSGMGGGPGNGMGGGPGNGMGGGPGSGMGGAGIGDGSPKDGGTPPQEIHTGDVKVFARKFAEGGDGAIWVGVDTWHVIGPFPNPGRGNMDRQFPPESAIDLDATYVGKDNKILRWEFMQSGKVQGVPRNEESYGIWYATTEVKMDRDRDVWLAMGSDDKGLLWINSDLVWVSGSKQKDWTPGEALRRVHMKAGVNRLLYRIENGHGGMGFSLCMSLQDKF